MVRIALLLALTISGAAHAATRHHDAALIGMSRCAEISDSDISIVPHGFLIISLGEFVHYDSTFPADLLPTGDRGSYWLCRYRDGEIRFFAPQRAL